MSFTLTPVDPPANAKPIGEFDALIPQVQQLQPQWANLSVKASEVDSFKRRFRDAANRAGLSASFAKDGEQTAEGTVALTFTTTAKRERKVKTDPAPATTPTPDTAA